MSKSENVGVERVQQDGHHWVARVRYTHKFDDSATPQLVDVTDVAQGAEARVRDGRVEVVTVPDSPFLDEGEVRHIARRVLKDIEGAQ